MTDIQEQAQKVMDSLAKTVREELDRKRRLGQYAVIWRDNKVVRLFEEEEALKQGEGLAGKPLESGDTKITGSAPH